jgi:tRNA (guanine9-N1)-methyltransferase
MDSAENSVEIRCFVPGTSRNKILWWRCCLHWYPSQSLPRVDSASTNLHAKDDCDDADINSKHIHTTMQDNDQPVRDQAHPVPPVAVSPEELKMPSMSAAETRTNEDSLSTASSREPSSPTARKNSSPLDDPHNNDTIPTQPLSKNQRRRLLRREKMLERKQQRKEQRRSLAIAAGRDLEAERQQQAERAAQGEGKRRQNELWQTVKLPLAKQSFQIALDCSFEPQMMEREIASLAQQLRYCYAYNKKATNPCLVGVTSLTEGSETLTRLQKEMGFDEWINRLFTCTDKSLEDYYSDQKSKIVYLSSDSENILNQLEDDKIYVIGGIVDRNRLKGVAMNRAQALGVTTAKLPLDDHLAQMASTPVLTCNHVFHILLKTREYGNDWGKALEEILPTRKEPKFKKRKTHLDENDDDDDDDTGEEKQSNEKYSKTEG